MAASLKTKAKMNLFVSLRKYCPLVYSLTIQGETQDCGIANFFTSSWTKASQVFTLFHP